MVNKRLIKLRKNFDLSQEELADVIGVHQTMISKWELGLKDPNKVHKIKLAKFFKVTVEYLFYESYYDTVS
ncbi:MULTISPECIES: helix-turn-helix transcriptional regulator [Bacillus]|uniref:helix-turn-helix transcriptional regulator n=1 Tax=Bacillus TaxID=1386 RepID=UPI001BAB3369|nr:helix-turn-helix transcriptional regulator [Bacillus amyloliquefaciens]QUN08019.1 helix-turn-helix transcriptional regulator [Bacillus amyloliquefaciens]QYM81085.1 helix-turn-helix domain-containing protein [Bacillus sp. 7D3]QZY10234.1 helix-turn-helix domain-containing protein [Bacillus amyloliquefaciens]QZY11144.1 helix-turn-helix domain-containing protein [Bacillus amyloliquefaciens]